MNLGQDTRGVSEVIGAILMFGLMIMLLAILQTQAIPAANQDVEFSHSDKIQSQLVDFHQAAAETARTGGADSTKLDMGVTYPTRMLFFNPPPPAGQLRTSSQETVRIENVKAEDQTVAKYVDSGAIEVPTRSLIYQPHYNEYQQAPTTRYEYGVLYNQHQDTQLLVNDGGVIQGRQISLLMPAGELQESSSKAISIDPRPVSAPANTVSITGDDSGNPIKLTLPSSMKRSLWQDAVKSDHVENIRDNNDGTVTIRLDPSQSYTLRMARIGVGSNTPAQEPTYLHSPSGTQLDIPQSQSKIINVEVRDQYNNPVPNQNVKFEAEDGSIQTDVSSGPDGVAKPRYDAPTDPMRTTIRATLEEDFSEFDPVNDQDDFEFDVWVTQFAGGVGAAPNIKKPTITTQCEDSDGNIIDDPVQGISGADAVVNVDWEVTHTDPETNLDTVDIRIIRQGDNRVGDTAIYAYDKDVPGQQTESETADLVDEGQCGTTYDVRLVAETTGNVRESRTEDNVQTP